MTQPDFIKSRLPFINAMAEGKTVELRCAPGGSWLSVRQGTEWSILHKDYEVRIASTPEEERLANNARVKEEWLKAEKRGKLEYRIYYRSGEVSDWRVSEERNFQESMLEYRFTPEPAPSCTPWTFETAPGTQMKVRRKSDGKQHLVEFRPDGVWMLDGFAVFAYAELLRDFDQLDGSPCGEEAK